jgi:hypothetical protein
MARPAKPEGQSAFRATVAFRGDQEQNVKALRKDKKLSKVCQTAVDNEFQKESEDK